MPPRRKSKRVSLQAAHISDDDDDDAFEVTPKSFRRYRASKKEPIKKESDETRKQMEKKHKMSSSPAKISPSVPIILDTDVISQ